MSPRKPSTKKDTGIYVRTTEHEKELLSLAAEREGMTFSEWVRWVLRKEARRLQEEEDRTKGNSLPDLVAV